MTRWLFPAFACGALVLAASALGILPSLAESAKVVPPPAVDAAAAPAPQTIVLAGGCFWGVQGVFQHVDGVTSAVSGYAGGEKATAQYEKVTSGRTGHAEAVRITYDPGKVSLGSLLQIYFSVAHDPTELNRQGPDVGPQYRSTIFPVNAMQAQVARAYIAQLNAARAFEAPIVTTIEASRTFYPAEAYHQDFLLRNPTHGYIVANDVPKVQALKRLFPEAWRDEPVRVLVSRS